MSDVSDKYICVTCVAADTLSKNEKRSTFNSGKILMVALVPYEYSKIHARAFLSFGREIIKIFEIFKIFT